VSLLDFSQENQEFLRSFGDPRSNNLYRQVFQSGRLLGLKSLSDKSWLNFFERRRPAILDIGCYLGRLSLQIARLNPHVDVLSIDRTYKRVVTTYLRAQEERLENLSVVFGQVEDLVEQIPQRSLSGVCLFFPDPWSKRKQKHHRLIEKHLFFKSLSLGIAKGGFFWFKTDDQSYFDGFCQLAQTLNFEKSQEECPAELTSGDYRSQFECLFENQKKTIYYDLLRV
jgi:tRNA (guanine-N7-)-methyltransferase